MSSSDWALFPDAEKYLTGKVNAFLTKNRFASDLANRMKQIASLRFFDWIDHMVLSKTPKVEDKLFELGFEIGEEYKIDNPDLITFFVHPRSILFPILVAEEDVTEIVLKTERLEHFIQMLGINVPILGDRFGPYRKAIINSDSGVIISAVERRGYSGYTNYPPTDCQDIEEYLHALETFTTRRRYFDDDEQGLEITFDLVRDVVSEMDPFRTCDAFFRSERRYWENRDRVGQVQKNRQDVLGLGWGNHDHHTYRSSRRNFSTLLAILETMGFTRREQFFAGEKAGWGAQVLEQPECDIVIFADVDISDKERGTDFASSQMSELDRVGTVGLWVELHGESVLQAGLHHLAARVDFEDATKSLTDYCSEALPPFSDFEFLKQSFSKTEKREIEEDRLTTLLEAGKLSQEKVDSFKERGAIGSHLEIIQRRQGFKGFNQDAVTAIIQTTDPRKN